MLQRCDTYLTSCCLEVAIIVSDMFFGEWWWPHNFISPVGQTDNKGGHGQKIFLFQKIPVKTALKN